MEDVKDTPVPRKWLREGGQDRASLDTFAPNDGVCVVPIQPLPPSGIPASPPGCHAAHLSTPLGLFFFLPIFPKFWSFSPLPPSMPVAYLTGLAGGMEWNWGRSRKKEPQLTSYCNPIQPKNLGVEGDKGKKKSPVAKTRDRRAFLRAYGGIRWPHRCRYQDYD